MSTWNSIGQLAKIAVSFIIARINYLWNKEIYFLKHLNDDNFLTTAIKD
jgi:hypothetical protein